MRTRSIGFVLLALCVTATSGWQEPASTAASARTWEGRNAEFETFLRTAPFERIEEVPIGVTRPSRGYFAPGGLAGSAAWKMLPPARVKGYWESYKSEIAAYELDKFLEIHMVPPAVEKRWKGDLGAAILWVEPVRNWKSVEHLAKPPHWERQVIRMKMFDNLIGNIDRNAGNLLVDEAWNLFLIDHSRAFVTDTKLPAVMNRIDQPLWERMLALDEPTLTAVIGKWADRAGIRAMVKRRDVMAKKINELLQTRSAVAVFVK